ncbi:hypothetical protein ACWGQ2_14115 [Arthrobacter sp. NPDC055585]
MSLSPVRQDLGFRMLTRLAKVGGVDEEDLELLEPSWLETVAGNTTRAEEALKEQQRTLQDMVDQGLISQDYLNEYRRIMDEENGNEHNGTDTD